jgi:protein O-mannosyl-transferase
MPHFIDNTISELLPDSGYSGQSFRQIIKPMGKARRIRQERQKAEMSMSARKISPAANAQPVSRARLWLALAFILPNLGALACGFLLDDLPMIVENEAIHIHSLRRLGQLWISGYSANPHLLGLYRPVSQSVWSLVWLAGGARAIWFHALCLVFGLAVTLLIYHFLLTVETPPRTAFITAFLFALFPIHTEATTSVVGSAELMAAAFGFGALILYFRRRPQALHSHRSFIEWKRAGLSLVNRWRLPALALFALAVFSKESAVTFAALPLACLRRGQEKGGLAWRHFVQDGRAFTAAGAAAIIGAAWVAHRLFASGAGIPPIDNPAALLSTGQRILTALWVQCLYLCKTILPITLSADYSYKEIPLVVGLQDWRAWAGLALVGAAFFALRNREYRAPILAYAILFSATSNIFFPIGTIMGERLIYAPSLGIAWLAAIIIARNRHWRTVLIAIALLFGARTAIRNLDWLNSERFYARLCQTSPDSSKTAYFYGVRRAALGDDAGAIAAYDRAIAIFPAYSEAYHNRGNALVRLGRREEAMESYRTCLRFDPGHAGAAENLNRLLAGLPLEPPRRKL